MEDFGGRLPSAEWVWVSKRIRDAEDFRQGAVSIVVDEDFCADIRASRTHGLRPHMMAMLRAIEARTVPSEFKDRPDSYLHWTARCAMADVEAFVRLLGEVEGRRLVSFTQPSAESITLTLTAAGWDYLYDQGRLAPGASAFVALPTDGGRELFEAAYRPALEAVGFQPAAVAEHPRTERIPDDIRAGIRTCAVFVADLTGRRPNVYFEVGLAEGLGIPSVLTLSGEEKDIKENVDFALVQHRILLYTEPAELAERLQRHLLARGLVAPRSRG